MYGREHSKIILRSEIKIKMYQNINVYNVHDIKVRAKHINIVDKK